MLHTTIILLYISNNEVPSEEGQGGPAAAAHPAGQGAAPDGCLRPLQEVLQVVQVRLLRPRLPLPRVPRGVRLPRRGPRRARQPDDLREVLNRAELLPRAALREVRLRHAGEVQQKLGGRRRHQEPGHDVVEGLEEVQGRHGAGKLQGEDDERQGER